MFSNENFELLSTAVTVMMAEGAGFVSDWIPFTATASRRYLVNGESDGVTTES